MVTEYTAASERYHQHMIPIKFRSSPRFAQRLQYLIFLGWFCTWLVLIHAVQLCTLPLAILPPLRPVFRRLITHTKESFAASLGTLNQFFGPSKLVLTAAQGDSINLDELCVYDQNGQVSSLNLDKHSGEREHGDAPVYPAQAASVTRAHQVG